MSLGWVLAASVAGGTAGGYYADRWLGTSPSLTLLGIFLGMTAGFVSVFRTIFELSKKSHDDGGNQDGDKR